MKKNKMTVFLYRVGSDERPASKKHLKDFKKSIKKLYKKADKDTSKEKFVHLITHHAVQLDIFKL